MRFCKHCYAILGVWDDSFSTKKKIIIWHKFLLLIESFQNFLEQILTQSFFKILKLVWSFSLFTHERSCWGPFESRVFTSYTIQRRVGNPLELSTPTLCSCCWGPFWKWSTYTLQLILWATLKTRVLAYYSCCYGGPFESKTLTPCSCCWGPLQKQST